MAELIVTILGTNGWYDTEAGSTISLLIRAPQYNIILDAGLGITKADRYGVHDLPAYLFLSHYHLDHLYGLHVLAKFGFAQGLTIFGQAGIEQHLRKLLTPPFSIPPEDLRYPVKFCEVPRETAALPFACTVAPLHHSSPTLGIRFEIGGRRIAYVPDTGYCENAVKLAEGADLLFTECANLPGEFHEEWPHLNPESAARIAEEGKARRLVLVHFAPTNYPTADERREAAACACKIFPESAAGFDGMEFRLPIEQ